MGENGISFVGFLLSYFSIFSFNNKIINHADEIFLIMSIPGYELLRLFFKRIYLRKNPFQSDQNHIHHLLLKKFDYAKTFLLIQFVLVFPYLLFYILNNFFISFFFGAFLYLSLIINVSKNKNGKI